MRTHLFLLFLHFGQLPVILLQGGLELQRQGRDHSFQLVDLLLELRFVRGVAGTSLYEEKIF